MSRIWRTRPSTSRRRLERSPEHPDIKVNTYRADSETVLRRIIREASASKTADDVVDTNDFEPDVMASSRIIRAYDGPKAGLRKNALFPGWTAERFNAFVVGWSRDSQPLARSRGQPRVPRDAVDHVVAVGKTELRTRSNPAQSIPPGTDVHLTISPDTIALVPMD